MSTTPTETEKAGPTRFPIGSVDAKNLEKNFTYHAPKETQPERYVALREKAKELATLIAQTVPDSREKSVALTNLETAVFWANAGIARNE